MSDSQHLPDPSPPVPLAEVLITDELRDRPARAPDLAAENHALAALAREVVNSPDTLLQRLTEHALHLCRAGSAGVSLLEKEGKGGLFRWHAVAGKWAPFTWGTMPRDASPCGVVVDLERPLLFRDPARHFTAARALQPPMHEVLLLPFHLEGRAIGTVWVVAHEPAHHFDAEDVRILESLSGFAAAASNLLERRASLHQSQSLMELIVENARDFAIVSLNPDRQITSWNPGAERVLGYAENEIIGQSADVIFTPEDRAAGIPEKEVNGAIQNGRASDERWHIRKDGVRFWGSGVMTALRDDQGTLVGLAKIFRDQTAARRAQEALEKSQSELQEALQGMARSKELADTAKRAKDHFLAVLSHELRTPLTPILMAVKTLTRIGDLPPPVHEALQMIARNVQVEARFIDELLDLTRIERGKLELQFEPLDLHEVLRQAVEVCTPDLKERRQHLAVELGAAQHLLVGDVLRLQQVFWNVIKNASKFTPEGGTIRLRSHNGPDEIIVTISDSGMGFPPEAAERIFEPFGQADVSITRKFGGLGLGLAIARATIEGHAGKLTGASAGPDQGATFTVVLPLPSPLKPPDLKIGEQPRGEPWSIVRG